LIPFGRVKPASKKAEIHQKGIRGELFCLQDGFSLSGNISFQPKLLRMKDSRFRVTFIIGIADLKRRDKFIDVMVCQTDRGGEGRRLLDLMNRLSVFSLR